MNRENGGLLSDECASYMTDVVEPRESCLKVSARLGLSIPSILLLSAVSPTCCFSRPPGFSHPGELELLLRRERRERHNCLFLKHA